MRLSLGSPYWNEEMWEEIWSRAVQKDKIVTEAVAGLNFRYALINPADNYEEEGLSPEGHEYRYFGENVTFWIEDKQITSPAHHVRELPFVFEQVTFPEDRRFHGLHEVIEILVMRSNDYPKAHKKACKAELGQVLQQPTEFQERYAKNLVNYQRLASEPRLGYFDIAIPGFMEMHEGEDPLQIMKEFYEELKNS